MSTTTSIRSIRAQFVVTVAAQFGIEKAEIAPLVREAIRYANGDPVTAEAPASLARLELTARGLRVEQPIAEPSIYDRRVAEARQSLAAAIEAGGLRATVELERLYHYRTFRNILNACIKTGGVEGARAYAEAALGIGLRLRQEGRTITKPCEISADGGVVYHDYVGTLRSLGA